MKTRETLSKSVRFIRVMPEPEELPKNELESSATYMALVMALESHRASNLREVRRRRESGLTDPETVEPVLANLLYETNLLLAADGFEEKGRCRCCGSAQSKQIQGEVDTEVAWFR